MLCAMLDHQCSAELEAHPACLQSSCCSMLPRCVLPRLYHGDVQSLSLQWKHILCSILQIDRWASVPLLLEA